MRRIRIGVALVACLAVAVPVLAQVSAAFDISWHVIAGGGGTMESAQYAADGTVGQAATGLMSSGNSTVCSGFWSSECSGQAGGEFEVYLPVVLRSAH